LATECKQLSFDFHPLEGRAVVARFDGGAITSDGGGLLLREVERRTGILREFAACFTDYRDPVLIEHPLARLVGQRVYGLCLGYEDLNDHDELRADPLLALLTEHRDPLGRLRVRERDRGKALAGKSTLNRLELTPADADAHQRYKKIVYHGERIAELFVTVFLQAHAQPPEEVILDLDDTDDPLHGHQEGRFFHGYYDEYCYLPLYVFCGEHLLCAKLRTADGDHARGALEEVQRIVGRLREAWPGVRIILRADSGFCREELMAWCEGQPELYYVFGLARNSRLVEALAWELAQAHAQYAATRQAARCFKDFVYQTRESWSVARRVVGKAEHLEKGPNPRFVVTNLAAAAWDARTLYEELYCARGDMENRIKEQQLYLFADRTSAESLRANQLRLWFSAVAYLLLHALRRLGLRGTVWEKAQCQTLRLKLLKIGALIQVSVRRVVLSLASGYPYAGLFLHAWRALVAVPSG
jgi:hypothetical protein